MINLKSKYTRRFEETLQRIAKSIEVHLGEYLIDQPRIDRISARAKSIKRFMEKAEKVEDGEKKYLEPLQEIQDQIGARIVTFYLSDVEQISLIIDRYYKGIESKLYIPDSEMEFSYFGKHYILIIPKDVLEEDMNMDDTPKFFELQIKTLFQHAWSESNHDLGYKPQSVPLSSEQKRLLAYASAQSWGADRIFEELFKSIPGPVADVGR